MKKPIAFLLCATLCLAMFSLSALADDPEVSHGGGSGEFIMQTDAAPFIENGRTYLPIRFVAEAFGIHTTWDSATRTAVLERGTTTARVAIGSKNMTVTKNGSESTVAMDVAPLIRDGRTFLPIRFIAEAFGLGVEWDGQYNADSGYGNAYRGMAKVSERGKTLFLAIGKQELLLYPGHFLKFYENASFRFAYPLYPVCTDLSEGDVISFLSPPWMGLDRIIAVSYTPVEGTSFADMDLDSIVSNINTQDMTVASNARITLNSIPAVAYTLVPPDRDSDIRAVCGVAFFRNGKLMLFEVSTFAENYEDSEGTILDEQAIGIAKALLDELIPALTMK